MNFLTNVTESDGDMFQSSFWFPQQIIYCKLAGFSEWKHGLLNAINEIKNESPGTTKSNVGGWQSNPLLEDESLAPFIDRVKKTATKAARIEFGLPPHLDLKLLNAWANVNKGGDYNGLHSHPWTHLASCLYVSVPEGSGTLRFTLDEVSSVINGIRSPEHQFSFNCTPHTEVIPSEGLLLLFPGNLKHCVMPGTNEEDRVSMAFNFGV